MAEANVDSKQTRKICRIRDPIHNYITLSPEEQDIVNSRWVQRLRHVEQLSGTVQVFPGATHNRFSHSLGVMHISGLYAERAYSGHSSRTIALMIMAARLAGLLHDIGHGPFSHAYDNTIYPGIYNVSHHGHDHHRNSIIDHLELNRLIRKAGVDPDFIKRIWSGEERVLHAIIQGPVGADRIDYLMRDSYFTGTSQLGAVLPQRIIDGTHIVGDITIPSECGIAYEGKVMDDVLQMLLSRLHMYKAVYHHKTSQGAMLVIEKMLRHAKGPLKLVERTLDLEKFTYLSDGIILGEISALKISHDHEEGFACKECNDIKMAKKYLDDYLFRHLPKMIGEAMATMEELNNQADGIVPENRSTIEDLGLGTSPAESMNDEWDNIEIVTSVTLSVLDVKKFDEEHISVIVPNKKSRMGDIDPSPTKRISLKEYLVKSQYMHGLTCKEDAYVIQRIFRCHSDN